MGIFRGGFDCSIARFAQVLVAWRVKDHNLARARLSRSDRLSQQTPLWYLLSESVIIAVSACIARTRLLVLSGTQSSIS